MCVCVLRLFCGRNSRKLTVQGLHRGSDSIPSCVDRLWEVDGECVVRNGFSFFTKHTDNEQRGMLHCSVKSIVMFD